MIQVYNEVLFSHKKRKKWNDAICSNMDGSRCYHTKWGNSKRQ